MPSNSEGGDHIYPQAKLLHEKQKIYLANE